MASPGDYGSPTQGKQPLQSVEWQSSGCVVSISQGRRTNEPRLWIVNPTLKIKAEKKSMYEAVPTHNRFDRGSETQGQETKAALNDVRKLRIGFKSESINKLSVEAVAWEEEGLVVMTKQGMVDKEQIIKP